MEPKETETRETKSNDERLTKVILDIQVYKDQFNDITVNSEKDISVAQSIGKQAKALKALAKAATELEWKLKKEAYETSRTETDKLKKEYQEIRDVRNSLMNACKDIVDGANKKIEDFRAECVRKAEAERRAKEEEEERIQQEKEAADRHYMEAEERRIQDEKEATERREKEKMVATVREGSDEWCDTCKGSGLIMESDDELAQAIPCTDCKDQTPPQQNKPTEPDPQNVTDITATPIHGDKQKPEEGQNGAVTGQIEIEIYDITKFLSAIIRGERGATTFLITVDKIEIKKLAQKLNCKPGEDIISGARVKE